MLFRGIPDHRPILLKESHVDYGPTPFRFFHSWLETEGFQDLVVNTWTNDGIANDNDRVEAKDLAQKDRIKWALEGDENTRFFHGTLKKKRRQLAIKANVTSWKDLSLVGASTTSPIVDRSIALGVQSFHRSTASSQKSLKEMFPRMYLLETDKRCSIASRVGLDDWSLVLRRNPRGGEDSVQFNALKMLLGTLLFLIIETLGSGLWTSLRVFLWPLYVPWWILVCWIHVMKLHTGIDLSPLKLMCFFGG
ncbi:hypothetical protein Tco_1397394 [Tanacetum coccineum]